MGEQRGVNSIRVNEIFYSLQGEGKTLGQPVLFIRFSGCNLVCDFCDTDHKESHTITSQEMKLLASIKHWVITGGEPLLHQESIVELISEFQPPQVEIETNGTKELKRLEITSPTQISYNISPKEGKSQRIAVDTEPILLENKSINRIVKFVYIDKESEKLIERIKTIYKINNEDIYIMPQGKTREELKKLSKEVWQFCLINKFNFAPRLHIEVWDNKKGI